MSVPLGPAPLCPVPLCPVPLCVYVRFSVTVLPPTNATGYITDDDAGDEDGAGTINNVTNHDLVTNAMRRDKFEAIFTNFHLTDNN